MGSGTHLRGKLNLVRGFDVMGNDHGRADGVAHADPGFVPDDEVTDSGMSSR
jgi:hypothetical protein